MEGSGYILTNYNVFNTIVYLSVQHFHRSPRTSLLFLLGAYCALPGAVENFPLSENMQIFIETAHPRKDAK